MAQHQNATYWAIKTWQQQDGPPMSNLPLPRPGRRRSFAIPEGLPPAPPNVPDNAWLRLLAHKELDEAVVLICQHPHTKSALERLFRDAHAPYTTLPSLLKDLLTSGRLQKNRFSYHT